MKKFIVLVMTMFMMDAAEAADVKISYKLSFPEAPAHYVNVGMDIHLTGKEYIDVKMPVWAPGSYLVREFSRHVDGFTASDDRGKALVSEKISKNTWRIHTPQKTAVKISYRVYAFELTVRTSFIDDSHAYLNGSSIFMYVDGMKELASEIKIQPYTGWTKISTGLSPVKSDAFTLYSPDYDVLADSPIEIGNQEIIEFRASGVLHKVAMVGPGNYDAEKIKKDFTKIVETSTAVFGKHPCKDYTFIVHNVPSGGGGLEHLNSTTVQVQRFAYANEATYNSFLSLIAHEYFHLWNVKRLRPEALGPFDYDAENYTRMLWFSEGFTAFYDNWLVQRAGFYSVDKYLELVANEVSAQVNLAGDKVQALSESSYDAWIKYYRRNENTANTQVSYYDKGSIAGSLLNLLILQHSKGKQSLDTLMSYLYATYYEKQNRGFSDAEFKAAAEQFTGGSLDLYYATVINGTSAIDYASYYGYAGLKLIDQNAGKNEVYLGAATSAASGKLLVTSVMANGPAYKGGLSVNDEIIAVDDYRVDDLQKMTGMKKTGDKIKLLVSRDGKMRTINVTLEKNPAVKYKIERIDKPTELQEAVYKGWIK